jgi:hypothetical protein
MRRGMTERDRKRKRETEAEAGRSHRLKATLRQAFAECVAMATESMPSNGERKRWRARATDYGVALCWLRLLQVRHREQTQTGSSATETTVQQ